MLTWPPEPTPTTTRLATVWPAVKFRFEASGAGAPVGKTVRKPGALGFVTVTFMTTAETPVEGTPMRPVTWRFRVFAGPSLAAGDPLPLLVSRMRAGVSGWNSPAGPLGAAK